jgi:hypothetical protein
MPAPQAAIHGSAQPRSRCLRSARQGDRAVPVAVVQVLPAALAEQRPTRRARQSVLARLAPGARRARYFRAVALVLLARTASALPAVLGMAQPRVQAVQAMQGQVAPEELDRLPASAKLAHQTRKVRAAVVAGGTGRAVTAALLVRAVEAATVAQRMPLVAMAAMAQSLSYTRRSLSPVRAPVRRRRIHRLHLALFQFQARRRPRKLVTCRQRLVRSPSQDLPVQRSNRTRAPPVDR